MNIKKALQFINQHRKQKCYDNISGIYVAEKITNGKNTGKMCVRFCFTKKLPLQELSADQIIPKTFTFENYEFITDVIEAPQAQILAIDCYVGQPTSEHPGEPVAAHRIKYRPLQGGISSISFDSSDATLGLVVTDKTTGQPVCLSNSHVYAKGHMHDFYLNSDFTYYLQNSALMIASISARQPGGEPYSRGSADPKDDYIGNCLRAIPVGNIDYMQNRDGWITETSADAAIVKPLSTYIDPAFSYKILNLDYDKPIKFATEDEIFSLIDNQSINYHAPIFRAGRTCGPVGYPGYPTSCNLYVDAFGEANVGYYSNNYISWFTNTFVVSSSNGIVPGRGGDSGSAYLALLSANMPAASAWKCIGLLYAGPGVPYPEISLGCSIVSIARDLNVVSYNSVSKALATQQTSIDVETTNYTQQDWLNASYITLSGRKYFLNGRSGAYAVPTVAPTPTPTVTPTPTPTVTPTPTPTLLPAGQAIINTTRNAGVSLSWYFTSSTGYEKITWWDSSTNVYGSGIPYTRYGPFTKTAIGGNQSFTIVSSNALGNASGDITSLEFLTNNITQANVKSLSNLNTLRILNNQLTDLDVSGLTQLKFLTLGSNRTLTALNFAGCTGIRQLDISNTGLEQIDCTSFTSLTSINTNSNGKIQKINMTNCSSLSTLYCNNLSSLSTLIVDNCTRLMDINCSTCNLSTLSLSGLSNLTTLDVSSNSLTGVSLQDVTIRYATPNIITLDNNLLNANSLNSFFTSLPTYNYPSCPSCGIINIYNNPGEPTCNKSIATSKGWIVNPPSLTPTPTPTPTATPTATPTPTPTPTNPPEPPAPAGFSKILSLHPYSTGNPAAVSSYMLTNPDNILTLGNNVSIVDRTLFLNTSFYNSTIGIQQLTCQPYTFGYNLSTIFSLGSTCNTMSYMRFDSPRSSIILSSPLTATRTFYLLIKCDDNINTYKSYAPEITILDNVYPNTIRITTSYSTESITVSSFGISDNIWLWYESAPYYESAANDKLKQINFKNTETWKNPKSENAFFYINSDAPKLTSMDTTFMKYLSNAQYWLDSPKNLSFNKVSDLTDCNNIQLGPLSATINTFSYYDILSSINSSAYLRLAEGSATTYNKMYGIATIERRSIPSFKSTLAQIQNQDNFVSGPCFKNMVPVLKDLFRKRIFTGFNGFGSLFEHPDALYWFKGRDGTLYQSTNYVEPSAYFCTTVIPLSVYVDGAAYKTSQTGSVQNPTLTCFRSSQYEIYVNDNVNNFALRNSILTTNAVISAFGNNASTGVNQGTIYFTPNAATPDEIVYCSINNMNALSGRIVIKDLYYEYK